MSSFTGLFRTNASASPNYVGMPLQTSALGVCVPIVYGVCRISVNLIWYGGFAQGTGGNKPGGLTGLTGKGQSNTTYSASVALALCEGPIDSIGTAYLDKATPAFSTVSGMTLFPGGTSAAVTFTNGSATINWTANGLSTGQVVYFTTSGSLPTNFTPEQPYYVVSAATNTITVSATIGGTAIVAGSAGSGTHYGQCEAQSTWGVFPSGQDLGYNGIAYIGSQNQNLGSSAQLPQMTFEARGLLCNSVGSKSDADPSQLIRNLLTNADHGGGFLASKLSDLTSAGPQGAGCYQNYCLAQQLLVSVAYTSQQRLGQMIDDLAKATNSAPVWNGGALTLIPYGDQAVTANGKTFTPTTLLAPVFTLGNDDFVHDQSGGGNTPPEDPISWSRKRPADLTNHLKVEYADADNAYNVGTFEVKNQALIDLYGIRTKTSGGTRLFRGSNNASIFAPSISAQLQLQREAVMNTCAFALDARYCVLDPMDVVAVPDPAGNLVNVRITEITENDDDTFSILAEELVPGMGTAVIPTSIPSSTGYSVDTGGSPGSVNAPLIFQAPTALTGRSAADQLYIGCSGGVNFGGAQVWMSTDGGTTYNQIGTVTRQCRQGVVAAPTGSGSTTFGDYALANPDNTNLPCIDMSMSAGVLETVSNANAAAFVSLCIVDWGISGTAISNGSYELFSYTTSTLEATNIYQIKRLYRAIYSSPHAAHAAAAPFMRLDPVAIFVWQMPVSRYAGIQLNFKFLAYNIFGQNVQSLASATAYQFTPV